MRSKHPANIFSINYEKVFAGTAVVVQLHCSLVTILLHHARGRPVFHFVPTVHVSDSSRGEGRASNEGGL